MNIRQEYSHLDHLFQACVASSLCEKEPRLHWKCRASASADYNAEAQDGLQAMHEALVSNVVISQFEFSW